MEPMVTLPTKSSVTDDESADDIEGSLYLKDSGKNYKESSMELQEKLDELKVKYTDVVEDNEKLKASADVAKTALSDAEAKIPTIDQIDVLVEERAKVIAKCTGLVEDLEVQGKSNIDLMKEVVLVKMAHVDAETVTEAYIEAAFDLLEVKANEIEKKAVVNDSLTQGFKKEVSEGKKTELTAREKFMARSRDEWKK